MGESITWSRTRPETPHPGPPRGQEGDREPRGDPSEITVQSWCGEEGHARPVAEGPQEEQGLARSVSCGPGPASQEGGCVEGQPDGQLRACEGRGDQGDGRRRPSAPRHWPAGPARTSAPATWPRPPGPCRGAAPRWHVTAALRGRSSSRQEREQPFPAQAAPVLHVLDRGSRGSTGKAK